MTLKDYPVTFPYGATSAPYSPTRPHRGADRRCPIGTPVVIGTTTVALTGNSGLSSGPHCHIQAWVGSVATTRNPAPYEFRGGKVAAVGIGTQWGNYVTIVVDGVNVTYAHLSSVKVNVGQIIGGGSAVLDDNLTKSIFRGFVRREATQADLDFWRGKPVSALTTNLENTSAYSEVNNKVYRAVVNTGDVDNLFKSLFGRPATEAEKTRDGGKKLWHDWWYAYGQPQAFYLNKKVVELSKGYTKVTEDLYRKVT